MDQNWKFGSDFFFLNTHSYHNTISIGHSFFTLSTHWTLHCMGILEIEFERIFEATFFKKLSLHHKK